MEHYLHEIMAYLRLHPHIGALFTFVVAFLESLPILGTLIPGSITMTLIGVLIGTDALPGVWTVFIASFAAFMGDCTGFAIGYWYNERLRTIWPFRKYPKWLTMGESFFKKHGGKSIIIGRFFGPARSTVPLIAGLLRMTWLRFSIAAIPSAVLWALMYMVPGIILGALSREVPKGESTRFFFYGLLIILTVWLLFWLIQHFFIQLVKIINRITDRCWRYLSKKNTGRFFIRFITNQQNPRDHHQLTLFLLGFISTILFLFLFYSVLMHSGMTHWNYPIFHLLQTIRTPRLDQIFTVISIIGMPVTVTFTALFTAAGFALFRQWRATAHLALGLFLSSGAVWVFKKLSHSARPEGFVFVEHDSSFPSGHSVLSFTIFSLIAFFIAQTLPKKHRWIPFVLMSVLIFSVGVSRLYLGAHWLVDIIGAFLLALPIVLLCVINYRRMPHSASTFYIKPLFLSILLLIAFVLPNTLNIARKYTQQLSNCKPTWLKQNIPLARWWESPQNFTPLFRHNRLGRPFQPFNVQWQGSLTLITQQLESRGWVIIPNQNKMKLKTTLQRFSSLKAQYHTALLPWLYRDKPPVLFLIKHLASRKSIIELRLWESNIVLLPDNRPLWLGATDVLTPPTTLVPLKSHAKISLRNSGGLSELYQDTNGFTRKYVTVPVDQNPREIKLLEWDGQILLIRD